VKKSSWRRFTKVVELMIFLLKNGNEAYRNKYIDNRMILESLKKYQFMDNKLDRGALVRERSDYLEKLIESKDEVMEERISGYRLRYGKVPDWGFEFLEKQKKPKVEDGSNL